jgi:hypothetical protein
MGLDPMAHIVATCGLSQLPMYGVRSDTVRQKQCRGQERDAPTRPTPAYGSTSGLRSFQLELKIYIGEGCRWINVLS